MVQPDASAVPEHVLHPTGQLTRLDEGQRPVQIREGVAVVPDLRADGGQVADGPGGVVIQPSIDRDLEGLLQVDPAVGVAVLQPGRADVGQGVAEGLLVVQPPGQLDRPPGPAHRHLQPLGQHVQLRLVAVGHGQLAAGLQGLQHGDGPGRGRLGSRRLPSHQCRRDSQRSVSPSRSWSPAASRSSTAAWRAETASPDRPDRKASTE
jgi:hypothetical protein